MMKNSLRERKTVQYCTIFSKLFYVIFKYLKQYSLRIIKDFAFFTKNKSIQKEFETT